MLDLGELVDSVRPIHGKPVCLAGKLMHEKPGNVFDIKKVMMKAFRPKGKLTIRELGNGLPLFSFDLVEDREWVICIQPWHFDGHLFAVRVLDGTEQPSTVTLSTVSMWVRALDLPSNF